MSLGLRHKLDHRSNGHLGHRSFLYILSSHIPVLMQLSISVQKVILTAYSNGNLSTVCVEISLRTRAILSCSHFVVALGQIDANPSLL